MKRGLAAVASALSLLSANAPAFPNRAEAADLPINGITIGVSIGALARTLGAPASVDSGDGGHRFDFSDGGAAYADDDGIVLAADARAGSPRVDVDGTVRVFPIGAYSKARADADLAAVAEFATPTLRSYRLGPRRDLVLAFGPASNRLARLTYGEPGQLARLGLLPGDAAAKAVDFRAPRPRSPIPAPASGSQATVLRVAVDRAGSVSGVDVIVASSDAAADAELARRMRGQRYTPAALDGRPISATTFVEIRH
jgi:hypothetical protein